MARVITVTDDEFGTTARIEIQRTDDGHVVRRIVVESESDSGVPEHLMSALIPFIGLPAVRQPSNGKPEPERRSLVVPTFSEPEPIAITDAARELLAGRPEPKAPEPEEPTLPGNPAASYRYRPGDTSYVSGLQRPTDKELETALERFGNDPAKIAEHLKVPRGNLYSWLQAYRNRKKREAAKK